MKLMQQYELYRTQFKNLAKAQIELIESESFTCLSNRITNYLTNNYQEDLVNPI